METASITTPSSLASYSLPSGKKNELGSQELVPVLASYTPLARNKDGWVTIAAQGDGIHILNLSNSQPIASHTLGPSTFFAAPALTTLTENDGTQLRRTYAAIRSAADIDSTQHGIVWFWEEDVSKGSSAPSSVKHTAALPHAIKAMHPLGPSGRILIISPTSEISVVSNSVEVISTSPPSLSKKGEISTLIKSWVFDARECTFTSNVDASSHIIVCITERPDIRLTIYTCSSESELSLVATRPISVLVKTAIQSPVDWTLTSTGYLSCLTSSGDFHAFQLDAHLAGPESSSSSSSKLALQPSSSALTLHSLALSSSSSGRTTALLPLKSSHIMLASTTTAVKSSSSELILQIWDRRYSILLASFSYPLPSALASDASSTTSSVSVDLVYATPTQAVLTLTPPSISSTSKSRSSVLVIPYTAPNRSTIASAMLSKVPAEESSKWVMVSPPDADSSSPGTSKSILSHIPAAQLNEDKRADKYVKEGEKLQLKLIEAVESAVKEGSAGDSKASLAFEAWVERAGNWVQSKTETEEGGGDAREDLEVENDPKGKTKATPIGQIEGEKREREMKHQLQAKLTSKSVIRLLELFLSPSRRSSPLSADVTRILTHILQHGWVRNTMVSEPGGLIQLLRESGYWKLLLLSLRTLPDIPEDQLVLTLKHHFAAHSVSATAMEVDGTAAAALPSLSTLLNHVVCYPSSPAALRLALRQHLSSERNINVVLVHLTHWVEHWCQQDFDQVRLRDTETSVEKGKEKESITLGAVLLLGKKNKDLPPFDSLLSFLQTVLDTFFLSFLTFTAAMPSEETSPMECIEKLSTLLPTQLAHIASFQSLTGPLEIFAKAAEEQAQEKERRKKNQKKQAHWKDGRDGKVTINGKQVVTEDLRAARRAAREAAEREAERRGLLAPVGLYKVEKVVI